MTLNRQTRMFGTRKTIQAFSLIELLVAVSLMSVIVLGLYAMFNETQKALRANVSQVDVLEAGRAAIDILVQDIEQAAAPGLHLHHPPDPPEKVSESDKQNAFAFAITTNKKELFRRTTEPHFMIGIQTYRIGPRTVPTMSVIQSLADGGMRTNILHETFFLTRSKLNWVAKGFFVFPSVNPESGQIFYGTLYRFSSPKGQDIVQSPRRMDRRESLGDLWKKYEDAKSDVRLAISNNVAVSLIDGVAPLIDGVVHFKIQPIDSLGRPMRYWTNSPTQEPYNFCYPWVALVQDQFVDFPETRAAFYGDALPAYVEVEIGVMDQATLSRVKPFKNNPASSTNFLREQADGVHLFRRMIPLRASPEPPIAPTSN
ncbi:MAG: hypothetical protein M2R45_03061 [Verrucomicrobia subdivision 3 bacterium]|nr:hypothetical protein [Limisphaerales bacterium]MCS1416547.1 hypothetical protein [Limisphaerales bacterium]